MRYRKIAAGLSAIAGALVAMGAMAAPIELNELYRPTTEGYLEFINPTEHPGLVGFPFPATPPGVIQTEEYTGYTQSTGRDIIEVGDSDTTAGDRADFDWVQENRSCETGGPCNNRLPVNHPGLVGAMGWTVGVTEASPHIDPGTGLPHDDGAPGTTHSDEQTPPGPLPHLVNRDYRKRFFDAVDVFSIISIDQDDDVNPQDIASLRAAALDYELAFGNTVTGATSPGVMTIVWIPGWTPATFIDDFVARWVPLTPGLYDLVAIEPTGIGEQRTEIDAIKALHIPEPGSLALLGLGLAGLGYARRRKV